MSENFLRYNAYRLGVALGTLAWAIWLALADKSASAADIIRATTVAIVLLMLVVLGLRGRLVSRPFQVFQLALDMGLVSVLSGMTGGLHSLFTLLYFPAIGAGAYLLRREGALWAATFATIGFVSMLALDPEPFPAQRETMLLIWSETMFRIFAFYLMALLTGQLGEQLARTGAALREEQESARQLAVEHDTVLDRIQAGVISTDAGGTVVAVNPFGRTLVGDIRGLALDTVIPEAQASTTWEERRVDGQRWVCSRSSLADGGTVIVIEDVTELSRMRDVSQRDERLVGVGRLAASMAHEIRNPLASLSGSLQLIREEHPSRLADLAIGEAERLNRLVEEFLQLARRPSVSPRRVDIAALAAEVCEAFSHDPRFVGRVSTLCTGAHVVVSADPDRVRQALWNLVINGAQSMPRGGQVSVSIREAPGWLDGPPGAELIVADEGQGIPESERGRVFDPFYTTRSGGTGLGLLLVEQVASGHGGHVTARAREPRGTEFMMWLPREVTHGA